MKNHEQERNSKEYIRPMPTTWWLKRWTYVLFIVRELTCVFMGGYAVLLLVLLGCAKDEISFAVFVAWLKSAPSMVLHLLALVMTMVHSITWFNLTPKVMVVWRGEERVSPVLIAGANYVLWIVLSVLVFWIAVTGV